MLFFPLKENYLCCDVEKTKSESIADAVLSMAALQAALKIRKQQAGELIKNARSIDMLEILQESDWERCHTATSEPYFYDQSYTQVKRDAPICIGICDPLREKVQFCANNEFARHVYRRACDTPGKYFL